MHKSKILAKFRAGKAARLSFLTHFVPPHVAYAADAGYDGVWLDLEHRTMNPREVQALLTYFHLYDIDCAIRVPLREKGLLYRYLEDGATGLIVPHVSTADEARDLVRKVKFPPLGDRGIAGGSGLEVNFGLDFNNRVDLVEHGLAETFLMVQIETPEGLRNVDAIAAVPGIDALFIGPGDMGVRMAHEPEDQRATLDEVMQRVGEASAAHGKQWGFYAHTLEEVQRQYELGARMLIWGVDMWMLQAGMQARQGELDELLGEDG